MYLIEYSTSFATVSGRQRQYETAEVSLKGYRITFFRLVDGDWYNNNAGTATPVPADIVAQLNTLVDARRAELENAVTMPGVPVWSIRLFGRTFHF